MQRHPPYSPLLPYTTLFRSRRGSGGGVGGHFDEGHVSDLERGACRRTGRAVRDGSDAVLVAVVGHDACPSAGSRTAPSWHRLGAITLSAQTTIPMSVCTDRDR